MKFEVIRTIYYFPEMPGTPLTGSEDRKMTDKRQGQFNIVSQSLKGFLNGGALGGIRCG